MSTIDYKFLAQALVSGQVSAEQLATINPIIYPAFPTNAVTDRAFIPLAGALGPLQAGAAAKLLQTGMVKHIILSGGAVVNDLPETPMLLPILQQAKVPLATDGEKEADYAYRFLTMLGVPAAALSVENTSTNTGANIENSAHLINGCDSVTIVTLPSPRALQTFRRYFPLPEKATDPDLVICNLHTVLPPGITKDNWHHVPFARNYVASELIKIESYIKQGFCVPVNMEYEANLAGMLKLPAIKTAPKSEVPKGP